MKKDFLQALQIQTHNQGSIVGRITYTGSDHISSYSPVDGTLIGRVSKTAAENYEKIVRKSQSAFIEWRKWPAPRRGKVIHDYGRLLRLQQQHLGRLVSYEMGKSLQEGLGEVQEMIDICDFSVGLSRQLYGLTMHSERPEHRMYEQWHPLGLVGIISAFNFPVAVWSWNAMIALVCGNVCLWKPSEKTPLCAIACQQLLGQVMQDHQVPDGVSSVLSGGHELGQMLSADRRIALISATGSTRMGRSVGQVVAARLGKSILELGGNNAIIVSKQANLDLAIRAAVFGAIGTAGQRCTTTRRLIVHKDVYDDIKNRLQKAYGQIQVGHPFEASVHMGPLIDSDAVNQFLDTVDQIVQLGGRLLVAGGTLQGEGYESGCYVQPCVAEVEHHFPVVQKETFVPILYLIKCSSLAEAIAWQNDVPQGLSSALITDDLRESEIFLSAAGSDCGIANVNIGTSGAEIGGAFGGEKDSGGGRESGSDAWKAYMRRQTNTINYGSSLPLAQDITFDL